MSAWLEGLLLSEDALKRARGFMQVRSISSPSMRAVSRTLAEHGAVLDALEHLNQFSWSASSRSCSRQVACECAQVAMDIRSAITTVEPFCAIAIFRAREVALGNLPDHAREDAAFLVRSAIASGGGFAAEAALAACHDSAQRAALDAACALRRLALSHRTPPHEAAPHSLRALVIDLIDRV